MTVLKGNGPKEWVERLKTKASIRAEAEPPSQVEKLSAPMKRVEKRISRITPLGEDERRVLTRVIVQMYERGHGKPPDPKRVCQVCMGKENLFVGYEQAALEITSFLAARQKTRRVELPHGTYDRSMRQTLIMHTLMAMCRKEGLAALRKGRVPAKASCDPKQREIADALVVCGITRRSKRTLNRDLLDISGPSMPYSRKKRRDVADNSPWGRAYGHLSFDEIKAMSGVFRRWRRCIRKSEAGAFFASTTYEFTKELYDLATNIGIWFMEQFSFFNLPGQKLKVLKKGWVPRVVQAAAGFIGNNDLLGPVLRVLAERWRGTDQLARALAYAKIGHNIIPTER